MGSSDCLVRPWQKAKQRSSHLCRAEFSVLEPMCLEPLLRRRALPIRCGALPCRASTKSFFSKRQARSGLCQCSDTLLLSLPTGREAAAKAIWLLILEGPQQPICAGGASYATRLVKYSMGLGHVEVRNAASAKVPQCTSYMIAWDVPP